MLFLALGLPLGLVLAVRVPFGHVPDERNHALRAESLLHGSWVGQRGTAWDHETSGLLADWAIAAVVTLPEQPMTATPEPVTPEMARRADAVTWNRQPAFVEAGSIAGYLPVLYGPGAIAIGCVKASGGGPAAAFRAVRIVNLLCFGLIGALALRVTRRGRVLMACTLLLPMTLSLAASCSQDGLLIACATLAAACMTRATEAATPTRRTWFAAGWVLLALVIASKPPYAPLSIILLLPLRPGRGLRLRAALTVLATLPAAAWLAVETRLVMTSPLRPAAEAGPLWPGPRPAMFTGPDPDAQWRVLAAAPSRAVSLPLRSIASGAGTLLHQLVGVLDYLCLRLPDGLYYLWFAALAASALATVAGPAAPVRWPDCLLVWGAVLLCAVAVGDGQYLQWTPVGMNWIGGIQGRYFLPLLPILAIGLPCWRLDRIVTPLAVLPVAAALGKFDLAAGNRAGVLPDGTVSRDGARRPAWCRSARPVIRVVMRRGRCGRDGRP